MKEIVLDTNVVYSALRSRHGASHVLLLLLAENQYRAHLTVPLFLEYEEQAMRLASVGFLPRSAAQDILDYICSKMMLHEIHFLWRPFLRDADDDMELEAAVASGCSYIVTHNVKDFRGVERFGLEAITPGEFLKKLEN